MTDTGAGDTAADKPSRLKQWIDSARDDFEREAPEVLEGMAADARKLARFLDDKAHAVRKKQAEDQALPEGAEEGESAAPESGEPSHHDS